MRVSGIHSSTPPGGGLSFRRVQANEITMPSNRSAQPGSLERGRVLSDVRRQLSKKHDVKEVGCFPFFGDCKRDSSPVFFCHLRSQTSTTQSRLMETLPGIMGQRGWHDPRTDPFPKSKTGGELHIHDDSKVCTLFGSDMNQSCVEK